MRNLLLLSIMKTNRKVILLSLIGVTAIGISAGVIFLAPQKALTKDTKEGFITTLANEMGDADNRQELIEAYCETTADSEGFDDPNAPGLYYDPSQSLFL